MTKRRKRSYPLGSTAVDKHTWFYQQKDGLHIIRQHYNNQKEYVCTTQAKVPWWFISRALSMHRRVQAERAAAKRR